MKKEIIELRVEHEIEFKLNTPFLTKKSQLNIFILVFRSRERESTNIGRIMCSLRNILPNFPRIFGRETITIVVYIIMSNVYT